MSSNPSDNQSVVLAYILFAVSVIFPPGSIAGVIVTHIKITEVEDEMLRSHHRWLMRTFWFGVMWAVLGLITFPLMGIGYLIWLISAIWFLYRLVRGWLNYSDNKAMYADL